MAPKKKYFSLFSGFGLDAIGASKAGFEVVGGIESDFQLAEIATQNLAHPTLVQDVRNQNFKHWQGIDHVHGSPPCQVFSRASGRYAKRKREDERGLVWEFYRAIQEIQPTSFSLEQVPGFKNTQDFLLLVSSLGEQYWISWKVVRASNYGVPQDRDRLFIRGTKEEKHLSNSYQQQSLFPSDDRQISFQDKNLASSTWYDAIADLIPCLPTTQFAQWQLQHLPTPLPNPCLVSRVGSRNGAKIRSKDRYAPTIRALGHSNHWRQLDIWVGNSVKVATPRCFARWQSVPDWFQLPDVSWLACKGIGNGVPCLLQEAMVKRFV
jgi:site-specific DNA-cytosine methylase